MKKSQYRIFVTNFAGWNHYGKQLDLYWAEPASNTSGYKTSRAARAEAASRANWAGQFDANVGVGYLIVNKRNKVIAQYNAF